VFTVNVVFNFTLFAVWCFCFAVRYTYGASKKYSQKIMKGFKTVIQPSLAAIVTFPETRVKSLKQHLKLL